VEARRCNSLWIASASACAFSDALVRGRGGSWWLLDKNHVFFGAINIMNRFDVARCNCFIFSEVRCSSDMCAGPVGPLWICFGATVAVSPSPVPRLSLCTCRASWQHNKNKMQARLSCRWCSRKVTRHVSAYSRLSCTRNTCKQVVSTWFHGQPTQYARRWLYAKLNLIPSC
jgi:hypothetical protein